MIVSLAVFSMICFSVGSSGKPGDSLRRLVWRAAHVACLASCAWFVVQFCLATEAWPVGATLPLRTELFEVGSFMGHILLAFAPIVAFRFGVLGRLHALGGR